MTLGSITGCLRRTTTLTASEISIIRERLEAATDILNKTRIMIYKSLEFFILDTLRSPNEAGDSLDVILDKTHGDTLVRNLITLILNCAKAIQARALARSIYDDMCKELPDLKPFKGSQDIPLSIPQSELAREILSALRTHFGRLPETIVSK
ncbi:hypothetical protein BGZ65_010399, partial [Modicella reniformis]